MEGIEREMSIYYRLVSSYHPCLREQVGLEINVKLDYGVNKSNIDKSRLPLACYGASFLSPSIPCLISYTRRLVYSRGPDFQKGRKLELRCVNCSPLRILSSVC